ncbi:MAG: 4'-phosphopantetheinyl transferase family protein [Candidatus Acidiferrales bacterium]
MSSAEQWDAPPTDLTLPPGEIHVWRGKLISHPTRRELLLGMLSEDERSRAERFRFARDSWRFVTARGLLRILLARYLELTPQQICFGYGPQGKPFLADHGEDNALCFNLSHSGTLGLFAFARGRQLGVDLERVDSDVAVDRIPEHFLSPQECAALRSLPERLRLEAFLHCWCRKEAFLKAKGGGLSVPLDKFAVSLAPGQPAELLWTAEPCDDRRWSLHALTPAPGYIGALAAEGESYELRTWQCPDHLKLHVAA